MVDLISCWKFEVGSWRLIMATIRRFEDLQIWQLSREQANEVYKVTSLGSFFRDFSLKDQINRSTGSVMDNIAEGFERHTNKEFSHFLVIAKGANSEVRSQLYRAFDRNHITEEALHIRLAFSELLGKKIKSFLDYLRRSEIKTKP